MKLFEFEFGICVAAETEKEAMYKVADVMDQLSDLDADGDPYAHGPFDRTDDAIWADTVARINIDA